VANIGTRSRTAELDAAPIAGTPAGAKPGKTTLTEALAPADQ
jgi:hypothetical protein